MPRGDIESQASSTNISFLKRVTTSFKKAPSTYGEEICLTPLTPSEEQETFSELIALLTDNQPLNKASLALSCRWYTDFLRAGICRHKELFNSALNDGKATHLLPVAPSSTPTLLAAKFIYEVARLLITEQDRALSNIVDDLVNGKYFKTHLDEDDDRTVPNQLAFAAIGWLLLLYDIHPELSQHMLHIKNTLTTLDESRPISVRRNVSDDIESPLHILLNKFGNFIPELKVQSSQSIMTSSSIMPKSIIGRVVNFGTISELDLKIEWVDNWALHLDLDVARWTLRLFRFPSYCRVMFHPKNIHHRLLVEKMMHLRDDRREPQVATEALFRELLITYRLLFGQDKNSWKAFQKSASKWNEHWLARDAKHPADPLLEILAGRSCEDNHAKAVYDDINAGPVGPQYSSSEDFPMFGEKLLYLQLHINDYRPPTVTKLLKDRRDPTARFNIWTSQYLLLFAVLTILLGAMQLIFGIWQVVVARQSVTIALQQLAQQQPTPS